MIQYEAFGAYILSETIKEDYIASRIVRAISTDDKGNFAAFHFLKLLNRDIPGSDSFSSRVIDDLADRILVDGTNAAFALHGGFIGDQAYLVYDYQHGRFLVDILARCFKEGFPPQPGVMLYLIRQCVAALLTAQEQDRIHGFLLPHSIHVSYDGNVKVYDFETARHLPALVKENPPMLERYRPFVHPAILSGERPATTADDIYSLGALLVYSLTGHPWIPEELSSKAVRRTLEKQTVWGAVLDDEPIPEPLIELICAMVTSHEHPMTLEELDNRLTQLTEEPMYAANAFALAFFMHGLYREVTTEGSEILDEERKRHYGGYLHKGSARPHSAHPRVKQWAMILTAIILTTGGLAFSGYMIWSQRTAERQAQELVAAARRSQLQIRRLLEEKDREINRIRKQMEEAEKQLKKDLQQKTDAKIRDRLKKEAEIKAARERLAQLVRERNQLRAGNPPVLPESVQPATPASTTSGALTSGPSDIHIPLIPGDVPDSHNISEWFRWLSAHPEIQTAQFSEDHRQPAYNFSGIRDRKAFEYRFRQLLRHMIRNGNKTPRRLTFLLQPISIQGHAFQAAFYFDGPSKQKHGNVLNPSDWYLNRITVISQGRVSRQRVNRLRELLSSNGNRLPLTVEGVPGTPDCRIRIEIPVPARTGASRAAAPDAGSPANGSEA